MPIVAQINTGKVKDLFIFIKVSDVLTEIVAFA